MEKNKKKKEKQKRSTCAHAYCEVCRRNHDQGRRHRYFPSHITAFSSILSRFSDKLSRLRLSLRNPSLLRSDGADRTSMWCIFCSLDLVETDSPFAWGNAITHLASEEHLRNVKDFLWKHGVGADMDRVDSFRVTDTELAKWEKCCESLQKASHSVMLGEQPPKVLTSINIPSPTSMELRVPMVYHGLMEWLLRLLKFHWLFLLLKLYSFTVY